MGKFKRVRKNGSMCADNILLKKQFFVINRPQTVLKMTFEDNIRHGNNSGR